MRTGSLQDQRIFGQPEDQNPIRFYMTIFMIFPFPAELVFLIFFLKFLSGSQLVNNRYEFTYFFLLFLYSFVVFFELSCVKDLQFSNS